MLRSKEDELSERVEEQSTRKRRFSGVFNAWELFPILLVAAFLRLYQLNITEFDVDQATVFRMARDAVTHGLLPATANIASIRINNPPGVIYLLMLPAAISANPLGGVVLVALLNIVAVLLTYLFTRRYFGRVAATLAAAFYATASMPLHFSRFIWQQNMIAPFVVFLLWCLFRGVVDRRKGWLFPAMLLLGLIVQLQETAALLAIPLVLALLLAPETVRWRDVFFGLLSLAVLYSAYLLWEIAANFADARILLRFAGLPSHTDSLAITYYRELFSPFSQAPANPHTFVYQLYPALAWLNIAMPLLVIGGFITAALLFCLSFKTRPLSSNIPGEVTPASSSIAASWSRIWDGWRAFRSAPQRCALLLLLTWQVLPLLVLSRHSVPVFPYYVFLLMPGPFILLGLLIERLGTWLQASEHGWRVSRYGLYVCIGIVLIAQAVGTTAGLFDDTTGNTGHGYGYNALSSMQGALNEADQLAQRLHLHHVYISSNFYSQVALSYLAEQMQTPATVFNDTIFLVQPDPVHSCLLTPAQQQQQPGSCLVLPDPASGPAMYLVEPGDTFVLSLLTRFARVTEIDRPARLGSDPYHLLLVQTQTPSVGPGSSSSQQFVNNLQLLSSGTSVIQTGTANMLVTHWSFLRSVSLAYRTIYTYSIGANFSPENSGVATAPVYSGCVFNSMQAGDQLIVAFPLHPAASVPSTVAVSGEYYVIQPHNVAIGPLQLENIRDQRTVPTPLQNSGGGNTLIMQVT